MTPEQTQLIRQELLRQLNLVRTVGLPVTTLRFGLVQAGFELTDNAVTAELAYLEGKDLCRQKRATLSQGAARYIITADGIDFLEREGLG